MIEKILERLGAKKAEFASVRVDYAEGLHDGYMKAMKIVQEVAKEYGNGWIPTVEMLFPRYGQKVLASVRTDIATHEVIITTYERQEYWHNGIITAWKPLDAPYQKGE
jgi:hypothetical protein